MKALKSSFGGILFCLLEIAVGVLLLLDPHTFTTSIIMVLGAALAFFGIFKIIRYFRTEPQTASLSQHLVIGILSLLGGAFCLIKSDLVAGTTNIITVIYGIAILVSGVIKVQKTVDIIRLKKTNWGISAISAAISLVVASLIIYWSFETSEFIWMFIGITLIVEALIDVASLIFGGKDKPAEATNVAASETTKTKSDPSSGPDEE